MIKVLNKIYRINFSRFCFLLFLYFIALLLFLFLLFLFLLFFLFYIKYGGAKEDRTPDLLRARQALSQLSYGPITGLRAFTFPC